MDLGKGGEAFSRPVPSNVPGRGATETWQSSPASLRTGQSVHFRRRTLGERLSHVHPRGLLAVAGPWPPRLHSAQVRGPEPSYPSCTDWQETVGTSLSDPLVPQPSSGCHCVKQMVASLQEECSVSPGGAGRVGGALWRAPLWICGKAERAGTVTS